MDHGARGYHMRAMIGEHRRRARGSHHRAGGGIDGFEQTPSQMAVGTGDENPAHRDRIPSMRSTQAVSKSRACSTKRRLSESLADLSDTRYKSFDRAR